MQVQTWSTQQHSCQMSVYLHQDSHVRGVPSRCSCSTSLCLHVHHWSCSWCIHEKSVRSLHSCSMSCLDCCQPHDCHQFPCWNRGIHVTSVLVCHSCSSFLQTYLQTIHATHSSTGLHHKYANLLPNSSAKQMIYCKKWWQRKAIQMLLDLRSTSASMGSPSWCLLLYHLLHSIIHSTLNHWFSQYIPRCPQNPQLNLTFKAKMATELAWPLHSWNAHERMQTWRIMQTVICIST